MLETTGVAQIEHQQADVDSTIEGRPQGLESLLTCSVPNMEVAGCFTTIHRTLRSVFDHVYAYSVDIPSFGSNWGFNIAMGCERLKASNDGGDEDVVATAAANAADAAVGTLAAQEATAALLAADIKRDVAQILTLMTIEERDATLSNRFEGGVSPLKYYDGVTHLGMFGLPLEVRNYMAEETRIMTREKPVFMY